MPDKLVFGDVTLVKSGEQRFAHRYLGPLFCQPVYEAAWNIRYVADGRPPLSALTKPIQCIHQQPPAKAVAQPLQGAATKWTSSLTLPSQSE